MFLVLIVSVMGVKPSQGLTSVTNGFEIDEPMIDFIKMNTDYKFQFHIFNISTGIPITNITNCSFHLYNSEGSHQYTTKNCTTFEHDYDIEILVKGSNFSKFGYMSYIFQVNDLVYGGFLNKQIYINSDGLETSPLRNQNILFSLIALCIFILLFAYKLEDEHFILKLFLLLSSFTSIILLPLLSIIQERMSYITYKFSLGLLIVFWLYVITYFIYWLLKKMNVLVEESE
jgi:hypothetical protein